MRADLRDDSAAHLFSSMGIGHPKNFFRSVGKTSHEEVPYAALCMGRCTTPSQPVSSAACVLGLNNTARYVTLPKLEMLVSLRPPVMMTGVPEV